MSNAPNQNGSGLEQQVSALRGYPQRLPRFYDPEAFDNGGRVDFHY